MSEISKITLPDNTIYDLKDETARDRIDNRVIASKVQPTNQQADDIWMVIKDSSAGGRIDTHVIASAVQPTSQEPDDIWIVLEENPSPSYSVESNDAGGTTVIIGGS